MKIYSNNGITMAVLVVIIIVTATLLGIIIDTSIDSLDDSTNEQFKSELYIVQQAIFQKYTEYNIKGEESLVGLKIVDFENYSDFKNVFKKTYNNQEPKCGDYYLINNENFESLGLSGKRMELSEFIVNYKTGEVYNNTKKKFKNKEPMYLPGYNISKDNITSDILEIRESSSTDI